MKTTPQAARDAATTAKPKTSKLGAIVDLLARPQGATLAEMQEATGWQAHSIRGAISGAVRKQRGLTVSSTNADGVRRYWIDAENA